MRAQQPDDLIFEGSSRVSVRADRPSEFDPVPPDRFLRPISRPAGFSAFESGELLSDERHVGESAIQSCFTEPGCGGLTARVSRKPAAQPAGLALATPGALTGHTHVDDAVATAHGVHARKPIDHPRPIEERPPIRSLLEHVDLGVDRLRRVVTFSHRESIPCSLGIWARTGKKYCCRMDARSLGPQRPGDPKLLRRIRAHQSWYRAEILKLRDWGVTPPPHSREYGSILSLEAAARGANFTSTMAAEAYRKRRLTGWGVEPYRCERYLTSSQTMTLNLFAPLAADLKWLDRILDSIGLANIGAAERLEIEYQPKFLRAGRRDRTLADAFIKTRSAGIVVETKLADQFSRRWSTVDGSSFYRQVNAEFGIWNALPGGFDTPAKDQLGRLHALGALAATSPPPIVMVHHPLDEAGAAHAERYRELLQEPSLLNIIDLEKLIRTMMDTSRSDTQRRVAEQLQLRYVAHELSDGAFRILEEFRLSRKPGSPMESAE